MLAAFNEASGASARNQRSIRLCRALTPPLHYIAYNMGRSVVVRQSQPIAYRAVRIHASALWARTKSGRGPSTHRAVANMSLVMAFGARTVA